MSIKTRALQIACVLIALVFAGTAQANYRLQAGSGGQLQIGTGLPLPAQVFTGGTMTSTRGTFPPLLVPPRATGAAQFATVFQNNSTTRGGAIQLPPGALSRAGNGVIGMVPTFPTNPVVFQVNTSIDYQFPSATATLAPGLGPAPLVTAGPGVGATMTYTHGALANKFGGPAQFRVGPGIGSAGGAIPGQPVTVYINYMGQSAGTATGAAILGAAVGPLGQPGASLANTGVTTPGVQADPGFMGGAFGPAGTVLVSVQCASPCPGLTNMVTKSEGFPWTTGLLTINQPAAAPAEIFYLSGTDTRVAGTGNISMVSGALSTRALSGPNGNRGWISLSMAAPEPTAALGVAGALAMLGLCHGLVRRRQR